MLSWAPTNFLFQMFIALDDSVELSKEKGQTFLTVVYSNLLARTNYTVTRCDTELQALHDNCHPMLHIF